MKAEGDVHANKCCYKFRMSRWTILFSSVIPVSGTRQINQTFIQRLLTILDLEFFKGLHKRKLRKQYRKITLAFWLPIKRRFFLTFFSPLSFFPDFFLDSFPDFFADFFLDFFHRSSYTSKAHSWVESLRDVARLDSWLCNYFIYRCKSKYHAVWPPFLPILQQGNGNAELGKLVNGRLEKSKLFQSQSSQDEPNYPKCLRW